MICVGIDIAKDKHDCFILSSEGEVLADVFTIPNNADGFDTLLQTIRRCVRPADKIKVGLEATGHYSYNILGFLLDCGLPTYVINPLHTNLYRKSLSLRKTKTDRVDARTIATMLMSDVDLKSYTDTSYHNEELKSLTRYRFDKVRERAQLKTSVTRLVCILFPELEKLVPSIHIASVYTLLSEYPGAHHIASANLTHLKTMLSDASRGHYGREETVKIRNAARKSIGSHMPAKSLELKHTIQLIRELDVEIEEIEKEINSIMDEIHSPITTIPGIGTRMGAMILAEVEHPIVHSDRGGHYRWPGWIARMDDAGLIRSMSKKGCSPDNSACEGFFGRVKNEMFYGRDWKGVSLNAFIDLLDSYLHWYNEKRIKMSLGGMSPVEYRKFLGLI